MYIYIKIVSFAKLSFIYNMYMLVVARFIKMRACVCTQTCAIESTLRE